MLRALWLYRGFILGSVEREFRGRYLGSLLGSTWAILNPLAMILVYTVIFAQVMKARLPGVESVFGYSIYLVSGLLPWNLFAEILSRSLSTFIDNGNLIKKSSFPRVSLPTIAIISASLNFVIVFALFLCFLVLSGNFPGLRHHCYSARSGYSGYLCQRARDFVGHAQRVLSGYRANDRCDPPVLVLADADCVSNRNRARKIQVGADTESRDDSDYGVSRYFLAAADATMGIACAHRGSVSVLLWFGLLVFRTNAGEIVDEL